MKIFLFHVFKVSIQQGIFLDSLQIAKVIPMFKSGYKENVINYRPISAFPAFSKVLERIIYNRFYNHLDSKCLLYKKELGFQRNISTENVILQLTRGAAGFFEKVEYTLGDFIDLDRVITDYGTDGTALEWSKSYLSNRKQYIFSQDVSNNCLDIICDVPQESILRPLLFLIYVNDNLKH